MIMDFVDTIFAGRERERRDPTMHGIATAEVTGRMPDGTYTVKYLGMGQDAPSAPCRMMMPNAGKHRGMYWMPEVGDEVVVAFEGGDSNSPVILGALFNSVSPTPDQAQPSDDNNVRTIVSRSGHEITLDDSPSAGKVKVKTAGGRSLTMDDTAPGKITLETPGGISMEMDDATGSLTLRAPLSIVLETASLVLSAGGISVAPGPSPGSGVMSINVPAAVSIQSAAISMSAAAIALTTTGTMPTCAVIIDGKPFGLHVHGLPASPPFTPPVQP
jgi:phage baseplate assembly protein gpV